MAHSTWQPPRSSRCKLRDRPCRRRELANNSHRKVPSSVSDGSRVENTRHEYHQQIPSISSKKRILCSALGIHEEKQKATPAAQCVYSPNGHVER